jgi:hypothetical protein
MKTFSHLWRYLAEFFLEWENVSNKCYRENKNTHFMLCNFFRKSYYFLDNFEKYGEAREAADDNMVARCMLNK